MSRSISVGEILDWIWPFEAIGTSCGIHAARIHATPMDTATPPATVANERLTLRGQPFTIPTLTPMIGVISGATSMAPITTAVESARIPRVAMAVDRMRRTQNPTCFCT